MSTSVAFPDYINQRYKRALGLVRNVPKKSLFQPSNADKLKLYGLYKQASFGDIDTPQPDRWDLLNRAKWESWHQFKGMDATTAKQQYVDTLIGCVIQFLTQLPENTDAKQIAQSLQHFEPQSSDNNDDFQSLEDDDEGDLFYTEHLQPEFLEQYFRGTSSSSSSKFSHHPPEHGQQQSKHNGSTPKVHESHHHHTQSSNPSSRHGKRPSASPEYPLTPAMSPEYQPRGRYGNHYDIPGVHRLIATDSFLNFNSSEDNQSDADTIDREVAAITAKIEPSIPHRSYSAPSRTKSKTILMPKDITDDDGESADEPSRKQPSSADRSKLRNEQSHRSTRRKSVDNNTRLSPVAERALENLQTDVTALTEQIDILRRGMIEKEMKRKAEKWTWGWLFKTTAKHTVVNLIILTVIFLLLLKRRSPIAYAILAYLGPWWKDIWHNLIRRLTFAKLLKRY